MLLLRVIPGDYIAFYDDKESIKIYIDMKKNRMQGQNVEGIYI